MTAVPSINSKGIVILTVKKGEDKMRKVVDIIQEALDVPSSKITNVHAMGGMTNINYQASIGNKNYIVRIPGAGTSQFINRKEEKRNLEIGVQLGN